ncbi:hypothetical protein IV203_024580 [Nitzschia inconspicua]|uniref:P-loop containing nucleoside triphosphate hydrolase protein n=1 Tax=Nitzschia inconspicua TaxID=303405 RepID=A0A9K3K533_9STRA|nr:hypothetical protein IV203_024580 [Nitzschia inconspicua]
MTVVPNNDVLDTPIRTSPKRGTLHLHNNPSYNTSSVTAETSTTRSIHPKTFPIPTKSQTPTTTTPPQQQNHNNMTYEIFYAPSNVQKYGSPVIPVEERDWLEAKRKQWPPQHIPTRLPLPIFVLNMPKSGTQSIFDYFASCHYHRAPGKHWTAHYWVRRFHSKVGQCLADNVWNDRPIAQGCGEAKLAGYAIYTDSGLMWNDDDDNDEEEQTSNTTSNSNNNSSSKKTNNNKTNNKEKKRSLMTRRKCFFPGVHGLENIAKYYPTATILHFPRTATEWVESSSHWNHLLTRYDTFCGGFPEVLSSRSSSSDSSHHPTMVIKGDYTPKQPATTESEWVTWYEAYAQRIRDFARQHPTLTYVESPLEDMNGTAALLERLTGIPSSCYGRSHVNKKRRNKTKPEKSKQ